MLSCIRSGIGSRWRGGRGAGPGVHKDCELDVVGHQIDRRIHRLTRSKIQATLSDRPAELSGRKVPLLVPLLAEKSTNCGVEY